MKRRTVMTLGLSALGAAGLGWWQRNSITRWALTRGENGVAPPTEMPDLGDTACVLTPEQDEGPFFIAAEERSDIREDRDGLPLSLELQLVSAQGCKPVAGARVEIWHCDAQGRYSGYPEHLAHRPFDSMRYLGGTNGHKTPENEKRFLRGSQKTDADGVVRFQTIVPGWYEPRVPHIHLKVFNEGRAYLTTQLYFPGDLTREVYTTHPDYIAQGDSPYHHGNDMVLGQFPDASGLLLNPVGVDDGLAGSGMLVLT